MNCGLLGRKLGHSYSPQIHAHLGNYTYELFEEEPDMLEDFLHSEDFTGLNVTVPYKKEVIPYLDELTPRAEALGAVNTIVRRSGKLIGHNTDYFGFETMLESSGLRVSGKKVLVLGSGGASNTVCAVLTALGANVVVISRKGDNHYQNLHRHPDATLIVNTTPVGMYPNNGASPIDLDLFPALEGVLDLIYNPARTQLLLDAGKRGLVTRNGLLMLVAQAKESAEWFTGQQISDQVIPEIHAILQRQMQNIILLGMPSCGKSTIGAQLATQLGKQFIDADQVLETQTGRKASSIITEDGEVAFRLLESKTLADLGKRSGLVIATGGGCVTKAENDPLLRQNGTLLWLKRDIQKLPTVNRPLSQRTSLQELYQQRKPLYEAFADHIIDNNADPQQTILKIMEALP